MPDSGGRNDLRGSGETLVDLGWVGRHLQSKVDPRHSGFFAARETLACSPAATSPWACRLPGAAAATAEIHGITRGRPRVIPEREHQQVPFPREG